MVKMAFCIPLWNQQIGPTCRELAGLYAPGEFKMLLLDTRETPGYKAMEKAGWNLVPPSEEWAVGPAERTDVWNDTQYNRILGEAEVVVAPTRCFAWPVFRERCRAGKLSFTINERLFKEPVRWYRIFDHHFLRAIFRIRRTTSARCVHFLTMGHWCRKDLEAIGVRSDHIWDFGYFTDVPSEYVPHEPMSGRKIRIGWAGRMLDWKRPQLLALALGRLSRQEQEQIEVTYVGSGPYLETLKGIVAEKKLASIVRFLPTMKAAEIPGIMHTLDVYAFTSGRGEGWGAVLNEAMGQGCVPIACAAAGSTLELVDDGVNGFICQDNDDAAIARAISLLAQDSARLVQMSRAAWDTMQRKSPRCAAESLVQIIEQVRKSPNDKRWARWCA